MLSSVIGHAGVKEKLSLLVAGKEPSGAYLFYGPPNVGKRTTAFETAKTILCENKDSDDCKCRSCVRFNQGHPDFLCVGQHEKIKVSDIDGILEFCSLAPLLSKYKIIILDNADNITWDASNRLLKVLEEPPRQVVFFLITTNPQALIPTVLNRCLRYEFGALSKGNLVTIISKKLGFSVEQALVLGNMAVDSSIDVFSKAGQYLMYRDQAIVFAVDIKHKDLISMMDFIDRIDKGEVSLFSDVLLTVFTDMSLLINKITDIVNADKVKDLTKLSEMYNERALINIINTFSQIKRDMRLNVNMPLVLKNALIKIHPYALLHA